MRSLKPLTRAAVATAAVALAVTGCSGGDKTADSTGAVASGNGDVAASSSVGTPNESGYVGTIQPIAMRKFDGQAQAAVAGRSAFLKYNCYGCHGGLAGGAMGPSLRDDEWKYGGTDSAIVLTLHQGRPGGMPAWKGVATEEEIKNIVTYIRSMRSTQEPTFFFSPTERPCS